MNNYCCFNCPNSDYTERNLDDICPTCGMKYGFPLENFPEIVRDYRIIKPLARGFYSVTYVAEYGQLADPCVLKVSAKKLYEFFHKNFEEECKVHARIARDSEHVVRIRDMFDETLTFGGQEIACHVAVLEYVEGEPLSEYLLNNISLPSLSIAQIGIDLFRIIGDLESKEIFHNDLRGSNIIIQKLRAGARRAEAIDESIKAVVIDLGSVADGSKSDQKRLNDIHWVARHLRTLSEYLLNNPDKASDTDYRLASLLDERAFLLSPEATSQRRPNIEECINDIKDAYNQVRSPWQERLTLKHFDDAYNAQTLEPWFVPLLLVDPDQQWRAAVSLKGPQVIIGMRGCGKTMLLRSLQFHARATAQPGEENNVLEKIKNDGYIGLYVSCIRLLETKGAPSSELYEPYARLLIAYGLEALRAVRHLQEIDPSKVTQGYYKNIAEALGSFLEVPAPLKETGSEFELERRLIDIQISLSGGNNNYSLKGHPSDAFSTLAQAIRKCSPLWGTNYILFLLDDVSTRFLNEPKIQELLSKLLFQSTECSFKLTTEAQTFESILQSPGEIEKARLGRDYTVFDLGAEVLAKVRNRGSGGKEFVEKILIRRAAYYSNHPALSPSRVLGDATLVSIAEKIATTSENSKLKKEVYGGISALTGVCVGDIGDIISIYELILRKSVGKGFPVPFSIQSDCYQNFCSRRIYDLNRREGKLKDFALTFAQASHKLMVQSHHTRQTGKIKRLRQYNKIYVRITAGDFEKQFKQLRNLIDAGLFILDGGSPRTKTRDSDPIQQFALTYRKLFGLSNYIGLSELDRFELSGEQLINWLDHPEKGTEILMRNLAVDIDENDTANDPEETLDAPDEVDIKEQQTSFFDLVENFTSSAIQEPITSQLDEEYIKTRVPESGIISPKELSQAGIEEVVLGLGFEARSLSSAQRLLQLINPHSAVLVRYPERGFSDEIRELVEKKVKVVREISYEELCQKGYQPTFKNIFVDVTGLAKPILFQVIVGALKHKKKIWIGSTRAENYYPLNDDVEKVLEAEKNSDNYALLKGLTGILTGEIGGYECIKLLPTISDESRRRILCAFASAKHERLLTILDERDYERIEIIAPASDKARSKLAKIVAEVAANKYQNSNITLLDSHDLTGVIEFLTKYYQDIYVNGGFNFELALTGSKLQAVACAIISAAYKVSQCWYISPLRYDVTRFTLGVGDSTYYKISL